MIKNNIQTYFVMTILILSASGMAQNQAFAADLPDLGTSSQYAVLADSTITNDPTLGDETVITGKLGLHSGTSITGFFGTSENDGPGTVTGGSSNIEQTTAAAQQAQIDATDAFTDLNQACTNSGTWPGDESTTLTSIEMDGLTLGPGVYCSGDTIGLANNGILTLDGPGVYIFKAGSALTTVENSKVVLTNGASADKVFWRVGSDATLAAPGGGLGNTLRTFYGTVIASGFVHQTGGIDGTILAIEGRLISLNAEITFASSTTVSLPGPTVVITSSSGNSGSIVGSTTLSYTATFSESVSNFILGDITVTGTANGGSPVASNFVATSGTTYTFDVLRGSSDGTVVVSIAANKATATDDGASNTASNTYTLTIDTISLTVAITSSSGNSDSTVGSTTLSYTATFSESVSNFILGDITVTGTANGGSPVASNFAGSGTTYTFDVLGGSSGGTVVVSIAANTASDIDVDLNAASNTYTLTIDNTSNGSSKEWATKPTFGMSYQTNKQFVTDGFGYSVFAKTITDNFHTDFSMVDIPTDTSYPLYAKGYFANQLKIQEFCFGIPETGKGYLAESCIEIHFDSGYGNDRKITDVKIVQDSNAIDDVFVQHEMASCNTTDTVKVCDKTMITLAFAEPLQHSVMMIKGIDWKGKSTETYLNEGFNVNGKQLTDLPTTMIPSPTKYEGLIKVTQSEKYSNIWVSDDERMFERNSSGSFNQINQTYERHQDSSVMKDRTHSAFAEWKDHQALKAKNIWDASKYVSTLAPSFAYDYPVEDSRTMFLKAHSMLEFVRGQ